MTKRFNAARAERRTQAWRTAHAVLFVQPDLSDPLEASIREAIRKRAAERPDPTDREAVIEWYGISEDELHY